MQVDQLTVAFRTGKPDAILLRVRFPDAARNSFLPESTFSADSSVRTRLVRNRLARTYQTREKTEQKQQNKTKKENRTSANGRMNRKQELVSSVLVKFDVIH